MKRSLLALEVVDKAI